MGLARILFTHFLLFLCLVKVSTSWRAYVPWDTRQWCEQVVAPKWPFSYRKAPTQIFELKGRTVSNKQDFRHVCTTRGAQSVCHRCEEFVCGSGIDSRVCNYQLQGILWEQLPSNIPTVTDTPFAVGANVTHRNDFGNAENVCLFTQGADCIRHNTTDFSSCALRCWGKTYSPPQPFSLGWTYPKDQGLPQGRVFTLAGAGPAGYADGPGSTALFNNPQALAVDINRNVYVADTNNHCIRKVTPLGVVSTFAGVCTVAGLQDGPLNVALFSSPSGITLFHNSSDQERMTIYVSDTGNHRIRRIRQEPDRNGSWEVVTWAGGRSTQLVTPLSPAGLQHGMRTEAAFNSPRGLVVDESNNIYVADTLNHLIRFIDPFGNVSVLAGTVVNKSVATPGQPPADAGCVFPCLEGVPGFEDGPRLSAKFSFPQAVALGENRTLYVVGDNRLRRITRSYTSNSTIQSVLSFNRVATIAGSLEGGRADGVQHVARFEAPTGVMMAPSGRVYVADSLQCRIRRVTPADRAALNVSCTTRLVDIIRPSGCNMYDMPVDAYDRMQTQVANHMYFQQNQSTSFSILNCLGTPPPTSGPTSSGFVSSSSAGGGTITAGGGSTGFTNFSMYEQTDYGTTYRIKCPPGCYRADQALTEKADAGDTSTPVGIYGTAYYADISKLCGAAAHMGLLNNLGGLFYVRVEKGWGPNADNTSIGFNQALISSLRNALRSDSLDAWDRTFSVHPYSVKTMEVYTMAGKPAAPLDDACGYKDGQPPQEAQFGQPSGLGMFYRANISDTEFLYITDAKNNMIRAMTAVCSNMCENGGRCVAEETCACKPGWTGLDCTTPTCALPCSANQMCVGGTCVCKPGYTGANCLVAQCVQTCVHGVCRAPDTCFCETGWFDANCTTPVCDVTCGNGGNCTNPQGTVKCTCPSEWTGDTCRVPVCSAVQCVNGGKCIAPDTCWCPPEWSGHDCSKPVCMQGFFRPDPLPSHFAPPSYNDISVRPVAWPQYVPCDYPTWCQVTNEFDCAQLQRAVVPGNSNRDRTVTGFYSWGDDPRGACFRFELQVDIVTNFRYDVGDGSISPYKRNQSNVLFRSQSILGNTTAPWSAPNPSPQDRQVPMSQYLNVTQGVYVCANGGNCTAPGLCHCAPGWIGFDCRTPVCPQGWYEPLKPPTDPTTLELTRWALDQGSYECSTRAVTIWENPDRNDNRFTGYIHNHPNYYSRYMDNTMGWPNVHLHRAALGDNTTEGWRRGGWWEPTGTPFRKGSCDMLYKRTCPGDRTKQVSLITGSAVDPVSDIEAAYAPRVIYTNTYVFASGRWSEIGGECIDQVDNGCYNNGTCTAPDTCECMPQWEGHDCTLPICSQSISSIKFAPDVKSTLLRIDGVNVGDATGMGISPSLPGDTYIQYRKCRNDGNCTLPDTCTCEKGWSGPDCTIPLCAQECFNGGFCYMPDDCMCPTWPNTFRDARKQPIYRKSNGDPQSTGWTGFDCNTPICVNAEKFVLNNVGSPVVLEASRNNGSTFQAGCPRVTQYTPSTRTRISSSLCNITYWYQDIYRDSWANALTGPQKSVSSHGRYVRSNFDNYIKINADKFVAGPLVKGEGIFACYNNGSCSAPDTCVCRDGWSGMDCSTPLCRHRSAERGNETVSCLNHGICGYRDRCTCIQRPSLLHLVHWTEPRMLTGYMGTDCSIAICAQGFYNRSCKGVPGGRLSVSAGGEGCYQCANGGNCTSPDYCTCPPNWTGYDCRTPVCTQQATAALVRDLDTVDGHKVAMFELDPCGMEDRTLWRGMSKGRGNCSAPNLCTCFCSQRSWRDAGGSLVVKPWKDQVSLFSIAVGTKYGSYDCLDGWEGLPDVVDPNRFRTCHLKIIVPSWLRRNLLVVSGGVIGGLLVGLICWMIIRRRLRQKYLLAKAERRRSRRSSEEERANSAGAP